MVEIKIGRKTFVLQKSKGLVVDKKDNVKMPLFTTSKGRYFIYKGKRTYLPEKYSLQVDKAIESSIKRGRYGHLYRKSYSVRSSMARTRL